VRKLLFFSALTLILLLNGCDRVPEFISSPVTDAYENVQYEYKVQARDPDGKAVTYSLDQGPTGMQLVNDTIYWTPTIWDVGEHTVIAKAADSTKYSLQEFTLTVHYSISGRTLYYNLADEAFYPYSNSWIRLSGNGYEQSTTADIDGNFFIPDVPPGIYQLDFLAVNGRFWSVNSAERQLDYVMRDRQASGNASLTVKITTDYNTESKTVNLVANNKSIFMKAGDSLYTFRNLFASSIETIAVKQWVTGNKITSGMKIATTYPKSYMYWNKLGLEDGVRKEYNFYAEDAEAQAKYVYTRVNNATYKQERMGYAHIGNTNHQLDLTRYISITSNAGTNVKLHGYLGQISTYVSFGQNHEKIIEWFDYKGWAPFRGINRSDDHSDLTMALNYPNSPAVNSGATTIEYIPSKLHRGNLPEIITRDDLESNNSEENLPPETVYVTTGVGFTPSFSWTAPVYNGRTAQVYVPTVALINVNDEFVRIIWQGVTTSTSIYFPETPTNILQAGSRYVFYVMAYAGYEHLIDETNIFYFPEKYVYWYSRSKGVVFTP
jgi:hypothetical protein